MREDNLLCVRKRKFVTMSNSNHGRKVYPNLARDDLAAERLRESMREKLCQELLAPGRQYGNESGIAEEDVSGVVREYRNEHRGR